MTKSLLRFLTCGSVDGGKSTLVGRMLYDAGLVPEDQLASIQELGPRENQDGDLPDFSLLLDGLLDERAQRITIDVAWRYFQTRNRKFILADAPGHEQYTSNMATGASQSDLALIILDAQKGVMSQTRRHAAIVRCMGIENVAVVVNKMDLVGWDERSFLGLQRDFVDFANPFGITEPAFLPVSALQGDNLVHRSKRMPWYTGPTLLGYLETVDVAAANFPLRFPVQRVVRTAEFRGYSGTLVCGEIRRGLPVRVLPSGTSSRIASISTFNGELERASDGDAVTITLEDDVDVTRGDVIVAAQDGSAIVTDRFEANVVWMAQQALLSGRRYELRIGTSSVPATVKRLIHRLDLKTMHQELATRLEKNDIGQCEVMTERPVQCDLYANSRETGSFILIDRVSNATVAAGMVIAIETRKVFWEQVSVDKKARANAMGQRPRVIWFTGLSGAGKSTIADAVEQALFKAGMHTYLIDGDNVRHGISNDLGFSVEDRIENTRRVGELAKLMTDAGLVVLVSLISPFRAERKMVRDLFEPGEFIEVCMSTPLEVCESRDTKGLYRLAREGKLRNFTGISSPYEAPEAAELVLDTSVEPIEHCVLRVVDRVMGQ